MQCKRALVSLQAASFGLVTTKVKQFTMKPADAYRLKYRLGQTIEPSYTADVDALPDELLAHILAPVDLKMDQVVVAQRVG